MTYRFGTFDFDAESGHLRKNARAVPLERQPARVLALLLARAGDLVSREEVRQSVWGDDTHVDFDRGLAYCLSQIRGALGDRGDNPRFIKTVPRRGYTFIAPVIVESATSAEGRVPEVPTPSPAVVPTLEWPARSRVRPGHIAVLASLLALLLAAWFFASRRSEAVLVAVSLFDNETGVTEYDRPVAGLSDLVVSNLAGLAPGRLGVIGNAEVLRRPRNIRDLKAVAAGVRADYVLLGQLQQGEQGLRFITHVIRLSDMAHLKANRLQLGDDSLAQLEARVVNEFERAVREHVLTGAGN